MVYAKCAKCGVEQPFATLPKKFCCPECGILNTPVPDTYGTGDQACGCLLPESFEWKLPSGKISSSAGEVFYTTADDATKLTRVEWIDTFGYDPEVVLRIMREKGKTGSEGTVNTSSLGKKTKKTRKL